jgi:hypothetical protein
MLKAEPRDGTIRVEYWDGVRGIALRTASTPRPTRPLGFRPIYDGETEFDARDALVKTLADHPDCDIIVMSSEKDAQVLSLDDIPGGL